MKRTELEKNKALKLMGQMHNAAIPSRFGQGAAGTLDRREQRKLDQAAGLVPFAVKLHQDLVRQLHDRAAQEGVALNELTARLLTAGLGAGAGAETKPAQAAVQKVARKVAVKKVAVEEAAAKAPAAKKALAKTVAKKAVAKKAVAKASRSA